MHESGMWKDFKVERKRCGSADGEMYECGMYEECARFMWHWLCLSRAPIALAGEVSSRHRSETTDARKSYMENEENSRKAARTLTRSSRPSSPRRSTSWRHHAARSSAAATRCSATEPSTSVPTWARQSPRTRIRFSRKRVVKLIRLPSLFSVSGVSQLLHTHFRWHRKSHCKSSLRAVWSPRGELPSA